MDKSGRILSLLIPVAALLVGVAVDFIWWIPLLSGICYIAAIWTSLGAASTRVPGVIAALGSIFYSLYLYRHWPTGFDVQYLINGGLNYLGLVISFLMVWIYNSSKAAALRNATLYSQVFMLSPDSVVLSDLGSSNIVEANQSFYRLFGHHNSNITETPTRLSEFWADQQQRQAFVDKLRNHGEALNEETWFKHRLGHKVPVLISAKLAVIADEELVISITKDMTDHRQTQERLAQLAYYDPLTGLANQRLFKDRLEQAVKHARRTSEPLAVLYLDLDQFKRINDTMGHDAGDALLQTVSERLLQCVRKQDTVARPGGDEFCILLPEVSGAAGASKVAGHILQSLQEPVNLFGQEIILTCSIGITLAPADGDVGAVLMKNADLAMYRAKELGRDTFQFFTPDMNAQAVNRLLLESDLRQAIQNQEFLLRYQPQVCLRTGNVLAIEALVQWQHPLRGIFSPDKFIATAESTGLIVPLGAWILEEACKQLAYLRKQHPQLRMAVNISARQFQDHSLPRLIVDNLTKFNLPAQALELEITESMLMSDIKQAIKTLQQLKSIGVSVSVDDFGTGYSSLAYLKQLPIDRLKIDKSFIRDIPHSQADVDITSAVIAMAHKLNLEVVAEGIEHEAQLEFLQNNHCDIGQGYYFSQPKPAPDLNLQSQKVEFS